MFIIIILTIHCVKSQWQLTALFLYSQIVYQCFNCDCYYSEDFCQASKQTITGHFITCKQPSMSYITLDNTYNSIAYKYSRSQSSGDFISFDLYFQGKWANDLVVFEFGSFQYQFEYTSPDQYPITEGFCDSIQTDVRTVNFTLPSLQSGQIKFRQSNTNVGSVSIRMITISRIKCYPSCSSCTGPEQNQCQSCYYGVPTNNICPPCPNNQYYEKYEGCKAYCKFQNLKYSNGFCQQFDQYQVQMYDIYISSSSKLKWQQLYDPLHLDTSLNYFYFNSHVYGIFKYNSGIGRLIDEISTSTIRDSYGIRISLMLFNNLELGRGIRFMINNTYYSSIYRDLQGIQTHGIQIVQQYQYGSYSSYSLTLQLDLYMFIDLPLYPFYFSAIGNFLDSTVGWGLIFLQITTGLCPYQCKICEVSYQCKKCNSNYYVDKDGNCISCSFDNQKIIGDYCYDFEDEIPYSKYLIKDYFDGVSDLSQYSQYKLLTQKGVNFLKGEDILYSYFGNTRIFGGKYVWSQAVFQRIHQISNPHYSITIQFRIIFGPSFPSDSRFIYTIDDNSPISYSRSIASIQSGGTGVYLISQKFSHFIDNLTIKWECYGENNEPIKAYCGFYKYFIIVHYCQPYCLRCTDQSTCLEWQQYDTSSIKLSQDECQSDQYYDKISLHCISCPSLCLTCKSSIYCLTCKPTYVLTKLGCLCQTNQYELANQCVSCPQECEQCLSSSFCLECSITKYRTLLNGQCVCLDGYYSIPTNPQCLRCHLFCKTCLGPTECLVCQNINNLEKVSSKCQCKIGTAYDDSLNTCATCHNTCLTCFKISINGCLTCDSTKNRILRGLKCECQPGYQELNNICTSCPTIEDSSLNQCYNLCDNNQKIWHTINCNSCDSGQQLIQNNCQPQCGDFLKQLYEECEDGNDILDDLCYNCQFQCPKHCTTCDSTTTLPCPDICGDGIISGNEECEDGNNIQYDGCYNCKYQCQSACTKCIMGKCYECQTSGWYTDTSTSIWTCKEQCGDGVLTGSEQCEDLNSDDMDGCYKCRYFCRKGCTSCDFTTNTCLSCEQPGYEPYSYYCKNICGDGLIVDGLYGYFKEYCDDGNTNNNDMCNSQCNGCAIGYALSKQKICEPVCGDSIKLSVEICESGKILPYRGCLNCKAKCQSVCNNCDTTGKGCLECKLGYANFNNVCHSICGDLIITEDEECEDGNLIYGDGCHFCRFSCVKSCLSCINGVCYLYEDEEDQVISKCLSILGLDMDVSQQMCILFSELIYFNRSQIKNLFQCHHKCQICQFQTCYLCQEGYELTPNKQECRQSFIFSEELQYCQISNGNICLKCKDYAYFDIFQNKCLLPYYPLNQNENCNQGYYMDNISQCGDGILTQEEECEIIDENCLYCKYQKPQRCNYFFKDLCLECELGYLYDIMKKSCEIYREYEYLAKSEDELNFLYCQQKLSIDCLICEFGVCLKCKQNYFFFNGLCKDIQTNQENEIYNTNLDQFYYESSDSQEEQSCGQNCDLCKNGICKECIKGFTFISIIQLCQSSDSIQQVESNDEYTLLDLVVNEYAYYCELWKTQLHQEYKFEVYNQNCQHIQEDQQIEQMMNYYFNTSIVIYQFCDSNCIFCNFGICSLCLEGSYIFNNECLQHDIIVEYYYNNEEVCGDKLVQLGEVCDDGNQIEYDGCFQCQFSCDQYCLKCEQGICLYCKEGFILNLQTCEPYCGDGLVMPFTKEECDDNNEFQADGCDLCKFECISHCLKCNSVHCFKCEKGYENRNEICISICGDGLVIPEFERCDDGNKIMYDGCFNCQYQCSQDCLECSKGICQLWCQDYRIVVDGLCLNQCGKLMVSYDLECDDNNEIDYDGCFECKYKCDMDCLTCNQGKCLQCNTGYILYKQQCYIPNQEENFSSMLGNQQNNWICKDFECSYSESPKLQLSNLGLKNQQYKIKIIFNQEVGCAQTECQEIFNIYFKEIEGHFYKVSCSPFKDQGFTKHTSLVEYLIIIELFNPISIKPTVIVEPLLEILNSNNQTVNLTNYELTLDMPIILEQSQKQRSVQMQITSKAVVVTSISFGVLSIVSGESTFVMELLNIVQYQSFLKFINQEYPENLLIYFQASEMISIGPYLQIFNIDQLINPIFQKDDYIQLKGKFLYYQLEVSIITNICPQIFQAFGIVVMMLFGQILNKVFQKLMFNQFFTSTLTGKNTLYSKVTIKILKVIRKGIKLLKIQKYYFNIKQIKLLLLLNSWDLIFKSILYLNSNKNGNVRNTIESTLSLGIITTYLTVLVDCLQSCRPNKLISQAQRLDQIFITLELCRTFFFSIILIIIQENQVLQTLLLFIGSFSQCIFIYKFKQVDKFGKILSILIEGTVSIFILSSTIYFKTIREYINQDTMTNVGFAHIGLLLVSSIILGFKQSIFTIKLLIKKLMDTKTN